MVRKVLALTALLAGAALVSAAMPATAGTGLLGTGISPSRMIFDSEVDCAEYLPDGASVSGITDSGQDVAVDVLVLLDGVDPARGQRIIANAAKSYAPHDVVLRPTFQSVSFSTNQASGLIEAARSYTGGSRPAGTDVVYVLTSKAIQEGTNTFVAGMADCIGGVKHATRAFGVSEAMLADWGYGPIGLTVDGAARVVAHELGHLLGAHHHYANCVEGVPSGLGQLEATPCTLMFNSVDFSSENFSAVNGTVVRQHAVDYAAP